jgi:RNA polymerase sigma factor (sigma-70 family)
LLSKNRYEGLDPLVVEVVRCAVQRVAWQFRLSQEDREDIEQTLIVAGLHALTKFNPDRGTKEGFLTRVVRNKVRNILAERQAGCRDYRLLAGSLQDPVRLDSERDPVEWGETFDAGAYMRLTRGQSNPEEVADLVIDLDRVIPTLPASLRATWEILLLGLPDHEAAHRLRISRQTLYERRNKLMRRLKDAGISGYRNFPPDTSRRPPVGDE